MPFSQLPQGVPYESNPFPALVPVGLRDQLGIDGYEFFRTLIETIRVQHTKSISGGTTADWNVLSMRDKTPQFDIGGLGRFKHPIHGIIEARYCELRDTIPGANPGGPVDLMMGASGLQWWVSPLAQSNTTIGFLGSYTSHVLGEFGWIIQTGVNTQGIKYTGAAPGVGTRLTRDYSVLDAVRTWTVGDQWIATCMAVSSGGYINPGKMLIRI